MKGDFTRDTYHATRHFSRVLMQQGRVQLDADFNEQAAILLHYLQALATDLIGPYAGPKYDLGFGTDPGEVSALDRALLSQAGVWPVKSMDFIVGQGRYYVDGILCENEHATTLMSQPHMPAIPKLESGKRYLAYLDVWERHVTALEDDVIREKALGGPDTATRAQVVWQVKLAGQTPDHQLINADLSCAAIEHGWCHWVDGWQPRQRGLLRAGLVETAKNTDPCIESPDSKYRGAENRLYRVEIHQGGKAGVSGATFKWSRENGSVVTGLLSLDGNDLVVASGRGFAANDWVELTSSAGELRGEPGVLVRLVNVESDTLTVDPASWSGPADLSETLLVRRWDQKAVGDVTLVGGAVPITEGAWIFLEDGIQVWFESGGTYRTGDYWLIPARWVTGDIEWPRQEVTSAGGVVKRVPLPLSPHGVLHHYAPLAILRVSANGAVGMIEGGDCRCRFTPGTDCGIFPCVPEVVTKPEVKPHK